MYLIHRLQFSVLVLLCIGMFSSTAQAACLDVPGDITNDGYTNILDVQCTIKLSLWELNNTSGADAPPTCLAGSPGEADLNCDGKINVMDVMTSINNVLGIPLNPTIDANSNQCVDACEPAATTTPVNGAYSVEVTNTETLYNKIGVARKIEGITTVNLPKTVVCVVNALS